MRRKKVASALGDAIQIPMRFEETESVETRDGASSPPTVRELMLSEAFSQAERRDAPQILVPVETTFDASQGIREVKMFWNKHLVPVEVIFDCRHLELADAYVSSRETLIFEPQEAYLRGKGGLLNTSVFFNLLRCCNSLQAWSDTLQQNTGQAALSMMTFQEPRSRSSVGRLWNHLGMRPYVPGKTPRVSHFQSRYVTPILWVDHTNEAEVTRKFTEWTFSITDRLSRELRTDLVMLTTEVISNLLKYGFTGFYGVSIWKSGQVEVMWSNPIDHLKDWPPDATATGLINSLQGQQKGGAGMNYIYNRLLPRYKGILFINCKGNDIIAHSSGRHSLYSQSAHDRDMFFPNSILFLLHLFCPEARDES